MNLQFKNFVCFSFDKVETYLNEKGEEKKKLFFDGLQWDKIVKTTIKKHHSAYAVLTGKLSNITVIDIDNISTYNNLLLKYPFIKDVFKVRTNKGIHLYFNYYSELKTGSKTMTHYPDVDIRNDGAIIITPPTKYKLLSGEVAEYKFIDGELMDIPNEFLKEFKQFQEHKTHKHQPQTTNTDETDSNIATSKYIYEIDEEQLKNILNNLDKNYLDSHDEWIKVLRVVKFMKTTTAINKYKIIDEWSIKNPLKYDKDNNLKEYNKLKYKESKYDINHFIREINKTKLKKDKMSKINYYIPLEINKISIPSNFEKVEFEKEYLYDGYTFELFDKFSTHLINSDTGTGKTYSISKHFKKYQEHYQEKQLLSIVSLISIADQQIKSFEKDELLLISYQTTKPKDLLKSNLVICLNSLAKIKHITEEQLKNIIVYIDEINLFLYSLTHNETLNNNIKEVYEILIFILKHAHKVIFTDAFITEQAFILTSIRKQGANLYINNTYQKFKDVEAIYLKNENEYFEQLLSDMNKNKYFMCLSDTIEGAERIYNYLYSSATEKQKKF